MSALQLWMEESGWNQGSMGELDFQSSGKAFCPRERALRAAEKRYGVEYDERYVRV
jgi:hypothetical protein